MAYHSNQWMSRSSAQYLRTGPCLPGSPKCWGDPYTAREMGLGGPHITRDMGMGAPISRGSPYRAYTGTSSYRFEYNLYSYTTQSCHISLMWYWSPLSFIPVLVNEWTFHNCMLTLSGGRWTGAVQFSSILVFKSSTAQRVARVLSETTFCGGRVQHKMWHCPAWILNFHYRKYLPLNQMNDKHAGQWKIESKVYIFFLHMHVITRMGYKPKTARCKRKCYVSLGSQNKALIVVCAAVAVK